MKTINIPIQFRSADVMVETANRETRTLDVCWSTGASVRRGGFFTDPYNEELDMSPACVRLERLQSGNAPVLNSHNSYDLSGIIGVVKTANVDGRQGTATVRFSQRDDVTPIWNDIQDGIIRNVSVGYRIHKAVKVETSDGLIPTVRAVDWEPLEISMVPVGADPGASARADEPTTSCELEDSQDTPASRPGPATALLRLQLELEKEAL